MKILISPLNWGLGHATRIVPLIKLLQSKNEVIIAADGDAFYFLQSEFPHLSIIHQKDFYIKYSKSSFGLPFRMLINFPKLFRFYFYNKKWIKDYISKKEIDLIISDNKFGFFYKKVHSVFITHQINIQTPKWLRIFKPLIDILNYWNIHKFHEVWIPDNKDFVASGILSDTSKLKIEHHYIGLLSRFIKTENEKKIYEQYEYIGIVSGPEPQKSIFRNILIQLFLKLDAKCLVISGNPEKKKDEQIRNVRIVNHLQTPEFMFYLENSKVISRAGYSTVMDLLLLKQTAILVPTPGQTEQKYLANYLHTNSLFYCVSQDRLSVETILDFEKKIYQLKLNIQHIEINDKPKQFLKQRRLI